MIILASSSPRRQELLTQLGFKFKVISPKINETIPENLKIPLKKIPLYLANLKAQKVAEFCTLNDLIIAADTIVCWNNEIIGKPKNKAEAKHILRKISGHKHRVITGTVILHQNINNSFISSTDVYFKELSSSEIEYYINNYNPLDKAGAYGIQDWIGMIGVTKINGDYHAVMGLSVQQIYPFLAQYNG